MIHQWDRLGIAGFADPHLLDPIGVEFGVDLFQVRQKFCQQFVLSFVKIGVVLFQIVANVNDMIAAKIFRLEEVGVLHQGQERIACLGMLYQ